MIDKKYHIITYGCQMNVHDSEKIAGILEEMGYKSVSDIESADIIVVNTCCVREHAEVKVYGNVGAMKQLKDVKPNLKIVVCGCMMQQSDAAKKFMDRFPFVDICIGTSSLHKLPELIRKSFKGSRGLDTTESTDIQENVSISRASGIRAWVSIIYGCNNYCSYCIVPYVRGRERSRNSSAIVDEVKRLADSGYKEIILLGQNVNSYGNDLPGEVTFARLLRMLDKIDGIERIRFMTSHPKDLSDELIDTIAECPHVCNQLHLPVQSGSNRILKLMNRGYTRERYLELIDKIRSKVPDIGLSTDVIVGFPSETEEDFLQTLDLFEKVRFQSSYAFKYSKRKGTAASEMPDQVPLEDKKSRLARLLDLQKRITLEINEAMLGKIVEVLPESVSVKNSKLLAAKTDGGIPVVFRGDESMIGVMQKVKITGKRVNVLSGELV
ncbi:MAG TPA: tRNA (N6-isopentenyl adenosine(37)-C2)-methylthiotransferase MiaB [Clostridia bacterium]|nr:tRNA (N6-isopentenyl adenosine(37)-C2)-methylthiotransferase MiaB [Clostridia bacterium]